MYSSSIILGRFQVKIPKVKKVTLVTIQTVMSQRVHKEYRQTRG